MADGEGIEGGDVHVRFPPSQTGGWGQNTEVSHRQRDPLPQQVVDTSSSTMEAPGAAKTCTSQTTQRYRARQQKAAPAWHWNRHKNHSHGPMPYTQSAVALIPIKLQPRRHCLLHWPTLQAAPGSAAHACIAVGTPRTAG